MNYTLIIGDAGTDDTSMVFQSVTSIRTFASLESAQEAGEAALMAGADAYVIPQAYRGSVTFPATEEVGATAHPAVQAARGLYGSDTIEFDAEPQVSEGATGTWVQAWVFVSNDDLEAA